MKWILCSIDGTSSREWRSGDNSHCYRFYKQFGQNNRSCLKHYAQGPDNVLFGWDSGDIRTKAQRKIRQQIDRHFPPQSYIIPSTPREAYLRAHREISAENKTRWNRIKSHDNLRIVLVGHSRGGAIVIDIARWLREMGVRVYFMGLFDAVDRSSWIDGGIIVNARYSYHALRGLANSRPEFGNTGLTGATATRSFLTSHGGMGGAPVSSPADPEPLGDWSCSLYPPPSFANPAANRRVHVNFHGPNQAKNMGITPEPRMRLWEQCIKESQAAYHWMIGHAREKRIPV